MSSLRAFGRFLIYALLLIQLGVAYHATIHPLEGILRSGSATHGEQGDHCALCQHINDASYALSGNGVHLDLPGLTSLSLRIAGHDAAPPSTFSHYPARGPPLFPV